MATYRISGIWKNENNVITHYAIHTVSASSISRAVKKSKAEAVSLIERSENNATTMIWNYKTAEWNIGENVTVVQGHNGKYLRSNPDNTKTDNLGHLINYSWIRA